MDVSDCNRKPNHVRDKGSSFDIKLQMAPDYNERGQNLETLERGQENGTAGRLNSEDALSDDLDNEENEDDTFVVPILPVEIAVTCCLINFVLPGIGTIIAGFSVLCCARVDDLNKRQQFTSCCIVIGIGALQLIMVTCFLIGWIWSGLWGISLVKMSAEYYKDDPNTETRGRDRWRRPRSNFIYPMRARSAINYSSPPPPYEMYSTPPPPYNVPGQTSNQQQHTSTIVTNPRTADIIQDTPGNLPQYWKCAVCQKQNRGSIQKFQCRRCNETVCDSCYQKHIVSNSGEKVVVCDTCYNEVFLQTNGR